MKLEAGQVAVITGAASGLGLGLAQAFADRGLRVVLADVERQPLQDAAAAMEASGAEVLGVPTDVRFREQLDDLAATTLDRFGRVDVICNNAGVASLGNRMWELDQERWDWVMAVNLGGVMNGINAFVPHLVAQGSGHVVNTSSMSGITIAPLQAAYTASKHAVVGISEALALDLADAGADVGVTVVCPGIVHSNLFNSDRNRPEEVSSTNAALEDDDVLQVITTWSRTLSTASISAIEAATIVLDAVEANRLYVAPNGRMGPIRARLDRMLADLEGS